ncbi:helix-turn-helix domain-containing protein, partial [Rhizobium ruizarguesonis]
DRPEASAMSHQRDWPGNVRELRNAAERLVLGLDNGGRQAEEATGLAESVAEFERGVIASALVAHGGSLRPVYESRGISRKTLYEKMQKYGLDKRMLI